ncbi:YciC family protein [Budvicia diplopodorum]|uniref:YciC family protein n=1 Tax=Budvicia diplopodorum TaxID=1119056 RepID=UPI00135AFE0E|nr:YciC family protein [Budvicia diplopodorum]
MPITANSLSRDSLNFMRNQLSSFLMLALLTSFIMVTLLHIMMPELSGLQKLVSDAVGGTAHMSQSELKSAVDAIPKEQQLAIVQASIPMVIATVVSFLVSNVLLTAGVITLVFQVSNQQATSALRALGASARGLPKLLILSIISSLIILTGLSFYVLPGVFFTYALALSPVILLGSSQSIVDSITNSWKLVLANTKIMLPIFLLTFSIKSICYVLAIKLAMSSPVIVPILLIGAANLVTAYFLTYLYRAYMLLKP